MTKIQAAILHKLTKEPFGESVVQTRDAELKLTPAVVTLVNQITHLSMAAAPTRATAGSTKMN